MSADRIICYFTHGGSKEWRQVSGGGVDIKQCRVVPQIQRVLSFLLQIRFRVETDGGRLAAHADSGVGLDELKVGSGELRVE